MKIKGLERPFMVIGENIHTTRIVLRKGVRVTEDPEGVESVTYTESDGTRRFLRIPEVVKKSQDYDEGRVKHVKIAVQAAMSGIGNEAEEGLNYLRVMVDKQVSAGADFLDLNVDEISLKPDERKDAMTWLVGAVQELTDVPLSIDSSNVEVIETGLTACRAGEAGHLLNSASLERPEALDLAVRFDTNVVITAAGDAGMPENTEERVDHASRMVEAAVERGIALGRVYLDPLIFPISVNSKFGNDSLDAIRILRKRFGPDMHITGGMSNVSFGLPARRLINDVYVNLAVDAGADSGIVDPVTSKLGGVFSIDRESAPYKLAEAMLLGNDEYCANFISAFRKGELK
jgi:5-methyltetrahydrofolate--homocysteine methyltransferase